MVLMHRFVTLWMCFSSISVSHVSLTSLFFAMLCHESGSIIWRSNHTGDLHPLAIPQRSNYFIEGFTEAFNQDLDEDLNERCIERFNKSSQASQSESNHNKARRDLFSNLFNDLFT